MAQPPSAKAGEASTSDEPARRLNGPYRDLCSTCDNRGNCSQPRPPGGVWRCSSYREERTA